MKRLLYLLFFIFFQISLAMKINEQIISSLDKKLFQTQIQTLLECFKDYNYRSPQASRISSFKPAGIYITQESIEQCNRSNNLELSQEQIENIAHKLSWSYKK